MNFGVALTEDTIRLTDAKGTLAGSSVGGWLTIDTKPMSIGFKGSQIA